MRRDRATHLAQLSLPPSLFHEPSFLLFLGKNKRRTVAVGSIY